MWAVYSMSKILHLHSDLNRFLSSYLSYFCFLLWHHRQLESFALSSGFQSAIVSYSSWKRNQVTKSSSQNPKKQDETEVNLSLVKAGPSSQTGSRGESDREKKTDEAKTRNVVVDKFFFCVCLRTFSTQKLFFSPPKKNLLYKCIE